MAYNLTLYGGGVFLRKYIFKFKGLFSLNVFIIFIESIMDISIAFLFQHMIDIGTSKNIISFNRSLKLAVIFITLYFIVIYSRKLLQGQFIRKCMQSLKNNIFSKIIDKNISGFIKDNSASYISILTNDINIIEQDYFNNMFDITASIISFMLASFAIFKMNFQIALSIFIFGFIAAAIPVQFSKIISKLRKIYSDSLSNLTINIKDVFSGFEVIKGFNIEGNVKDEFDGYNKKAENTKFNFIKESSLAETLSSISGFSIYLVIIILGAYKLIKGSMTPGELFAVLQLSNSIVNPVVTLSQKFNRLNSVSLIEDKIKQVCNGNNQITGVISKSGFDKIEFSNLSFSYNKDKQVLKNINMTIEKGKKYAIVGGSGSGKSTIIRLLLKYYDSYTGSILLDGVDLRNINTQDIYKLISIIHQNIFIFDSTIKDNITLYKDYTDEEINEALIKSGLYDFVNSKPKKLLESVGENGCLLSGGEKQRLAVARALIKKTPLLILDEATSSLDSETAYNIEKSILNIKGLTCIIVTHKLSESTLKYYDSIIAVHNGAIAEQGSFYELLGNKGYFYSLFNVYE